jgi:hypothetical protein
MDHPRLEFNCKDYGSHELEVIHGFRTKTHASTIH